MAATAALVSFLCLYLDSWFSSFLERLVISREFRHVLLLGAILKQATPNVQMSF